MKITIEKKTDQLNFEDFLGGVVRTVTITDVRAGTKEQQYDLAIEGDTRVWRPAVTVLKLMAAAWGTDAKDWVGRRAELYGDPTVTFGREKVGGIRVSRLSNLPDGKPFSVALTETRGKRKVHTVDPLPDVAPVVDYDALLADATTPDEVKAIGNQAIAARALTDDLRDKVTARLAEVS